MFDDNTNSKKYSVDNAISMEIPIVLSIPPEILYKIVFSVTDIDDRLDLLASLMLVCRDLNIIFREFFYWQAIYHNKILESDSWFYRQDNFEYENDNIKKLFAYVSENDGYIAGSYLAIRTVGKSYSECSDIPITVYIPKSILGNVLEFIHENFVIQKYKYVNKSVTSLTLDKIHRPVVIVALDYSGSMMEIVSCAIGTNQRIIFKNGLYCTLDYLHTISIKKTIIHKTNQCPYDQYYAMALGFKIYGMKNVKNIEHYNFYFGKNEYYGFDSIDKIINGMEIYRPENQYNPVQIHIDDLDISKLKIKQTSPASYIFLIETEPYNYFLNTIELEIKPFFVEHVNTITIISGQYQFRISNDNAMKMKNIINCVTQNLPKEVIIKDNIIGYNDMFYIVDAKVVDPSKFIQSDEIYIRPRIFFFYNTVHIIYVCFGIYH